MANVMEYARMCNAGGDKVRWCKFEGPAMQVTEMLLMIGCECVSYGDVARSDKVIG